MPSYDPARAETNVHPAHESGQSGSNDQDAVRLDSSRKPASVPVPDPAPALLVPKAGFVAKRLTNQQPALLALKTNVGIVDEMCEEYPRFERFLATMWSTMVGLVTFAVTLAFTTSTVSDAGGNIAQTLSAAATNWETWLFAAVIPGAIVHVGRRLKK